MNIIKHLSVPTGDILVVQGSQGPLELISVGDYGKERNLKADFLGLTQPIEGVAHGEIMPLSTKWVVTISTQYGCSMGCPYCDVPKVGPGRNASLNDMVQQVLTAIRLHPEVERTDRLNIHFARMGEPSWNANVLEAARWFKTHLEPGDCGPKYKVHPVVSTMMPRRNGWLKTFVHAWMRLKNRVYDGNAGLQISLNSTNSKQRHFLFGGNACELHEIGEIMAGCVPYGRKIALNVALASDTIVDPDVLLRFFSPEHYLVKITPLHETAACQANGLHTPEGYISYEAYAPLEEALKKAGYDVIVFVPSREEDDGMITCGNAILSGRVPKARFREVACS